MAQSRLEKIGTIFTRVSGLLRSSAMKPEDKPIWYDVYAAFPPKQEPRFDRPAANVPIKNIFYTEDVVRAKYHKSVKQIDMVNLEQTKWSTQTQEFIEIYNRLKADGPLDDSQIFETAQDLLARKREEKRGGGEATSASDAYVGGSLAETFNDATNSQDNTSTSSNINIKNLFKD